MQALRLARATHRPDHFALPCAQLMLIEPIKKPLLNRVVHARQVKECGAQVYAEDSSGRDNLRGFVL